MCAASLRRLLPPPIRIRSLRYISSSAAPIRSNPESQQHSQPPQNDLPSPDPPTTTTTTTTATPPLVYPSAPSPHHTDLPSFLAHAARTNLDPSSTVYVGTHFEYTVLRALGRYGLELRRVGGVSDCGIDLLGTWSIPPAPPPGASVGGRPPLRVLAQCKAVQRPGPHLVRELEGAFVGAPAGWRGMSGVVGLLVTEKPATKGIREALARSRWPMGFVACSRQGEVGQFLWNRRAEDEGLEGLGVGMRYVGGGAGGKELVLTWKGRNLPYVVGVEENTG